MRASQPLRLAAAGAAILVMALLVIVVLSASNLAFTLFDQLSEISQWLAIAYLAGLAIFAGAGGIFIWWLLAPPKSAAETVPPPPDENELRADISRHGEAGVDVGSPSSELEELDQRRAAGSVYIALYGEISHGKTSLIQALIPEAQADTDVRGGTTQTVVHYTWHAPSGDRLILADVPGFNEAERSFEDTAREEALRAHLVVFVCDGDLTRDQWEQLSELRQFAKPLIVAINKKDRYRTEDLTTIEGRLRQRLDPETQVVAVQAGGREEIIRVLPDAREERVERERAPDVEALVFAIQNTLLEREDLLTRLRDHAVVLLAAGKLSESLTAYREQAASEIVARYTRRAVIGGLAAFAPGADLVIQGSLAIGLTRALCALYEVPVKQVDLDRLIKSASGKVAKPTPLLLAVAGNALKAFPGTGTVAGGIAHAVAYGLLFQSLGRALAATLQSQGELNTQRVIEAFEEKLSDDLAARAKALVTLALSQKE